MTTIDDGFLSRRNVLYAIKWGGIGLAGAGVVVGVLYLGMTETMRYREGYIKRFVTALAENQKRDPTYKPHLLITYDQCDPLQNQSGGAFSLARQIPQAEIDNVRGQLEKEASRDRQQQLRQRYDSINLANRLAGECQHAGIKYHFMGTGPHPSVDDLVVIILSDPPIVPTHILYTHSAVDPEVAGAVEQKYSHATNLRPESLWVTKTTIEDMANDKK